MNRLVLDRPRDAGDLLWDTFATFRARRGLFLALALPAVAITTVLVDGVWGGGFADGPDADPAAGAMVAATLVDLLVVIPLITALHVRVVQALAAGEEPTVGSAFAAAVPVLGAVALVIAMYMVVVVIGFAAFVVPGVWLAVRLAFGAQVAVVEEVRGVDALRRSSELVKGRWWATFGTVLLLTIVGALAVGLLGLGAELLASATDSGLIWVLGVTLASAVGYSLQAIGMTLLFFSVRARREERFSGFAPPAAAPEGVL